MILRLSVVFFFLGALAHGAYAQRVSVAVDDTTHVQDSVKRLSQRAVSVQQTAQEKRAQQQQLLKRLEEVRNPKVYRENGVAQQQVYSQKYQDALEDSLRSLAGNPKLPGDMIPTREVSREEMLDALKQKFMTAPALPSADTAGLKNRMPGLPELPPMKLPAEDLAGMVPLPASQVKTKYLEGLDSVRGIRLKAERLTLKEKDVSEHAKSAVFSQKPTFRQRSYFEGILGVISAREFTLYQASPSLGYHFTDYFSLGAGPIIQLQTDGKDLHAVAGVRTFSKVEFWKRQLYLQAEDAITPYSGSQEDRAWDKHNLLVGGGALLSVKAPVTLNFCVMYKVNEGNASMSDISPLVFRIGISTIKVDK